MHVYKEFVFRKEYDYLLKFDNWTLKIYIRIIKHSNIPPSFALLANERVIHSV